MGLGVFQRSLSFLLLPFVSRVLPPDEFGIIVTLSVTLSLLTVVLAAPLEPAIFRAAARGSEAKEMAGVIWNARIYLIVLVPAASLMVAAAVWLCGDRSTDSLATLWAVELAAYGFMAALTSYGLPMARATDRLAIFSMLSIVWSISLVGFKLWFVGELGMGAFGWVLADLVACLAGWAGVVALLVFRTPELTSRVVGGAGRLIAFSLPIVPHRLAFWALMSLNRPALALFADASDVGIFGMAVTISAGATLLLAELNNALLLEYANETVPAPTQRSAEIARKQFLIASIFPSVVALGLAATGEAIIGPAYATSLLLFALLIPGQVCYGVYVIPMNYIVYAAGRSNLSSIGSSVGACATFVCIVAAGVTDMLWLACLGTSLGYFVMSAFAVALARYQGIMHSWRGIRPRLGTYFLWALAPLVSALALVLPGAGRWTCFAVGIACVTGLVLATFDIKVPLRNRSDQGEVKDDSPSADEDLAGCVD